jgi:hypothetical protein
MPGSGTSWRASDLPTWEEARPVLVTALNRLERDVSTILSELREADRQAGGDEVRLRSAEAGVAEIRALIQTLKDGDIREARHKAANAEQKVLALQAERDEETREERRHGWRTAGIGGGSAVGAYGVIELVRQLLERLVQ